ncbi:endonuclease/exonuclease/phosphatase family protein [Sphingomonas sp. CJ99]
MLTVASYNIHKAVGTDRQRRPDRIVRVLSELNADIVALQECDRRFGTRQAVLPGHVLNDHGAWQVVPIAQRQASMGWHGNGLLVRPDATILHAEALHLPVLEPRGAALAELRIRGREVRVVGMHLDLSGLWRRRQAQAILAHLAARPVPMPTVLMGDLNEWRPRGGCIADFCGSYRLADTGPSFHSRRPVGRLDRIMVSSDLSISECGVHQSVTAHAASDHLPVWARLTPA